MYRRVFRLALAATLAASPVALAAQTNTSQSYEFLKAVREEDGTKVMDFLNQPGQLLVNARDRTTGEGALHIVAKRSDAAYLRVLLAKGANPNLQDGQGNTPALLAAERGFADGVDTLIRYKADLNLANGRGETPLIRAVQMRNLDMVRRLLAGGADPDRADVIAGMSARDYARRDTRTPALTKMLDAAPGRPGKKAAGPRL